MSQIKVELPATLSNQIIGLGTSAIALGLYDTFEIEESRSGLNIEIFGFGEDVLSKSINNKIVEVLRAIGLKIGKGISGLNIRIESKIPRGVGLGSSAAATLGGALAANSIFGLGLSRAEVFGKSTEYESNAAAIAACFFGGMSIVAPTDTETIYNSLSIAPMSVCLAAPCLEMPEATSVKSLGSDLPLDARNIGFNALLTEALRSGDFDLMRRLMKSFDLTSLAPSLRSWLPSAATRALSEGAAFVMPCSFGPGVCAFAEKNHEAICGTLVKYIEESFDCDVKSWIVPVNNHGISMSEVKAISRSEPYSGSVFISDQDH